MNDASTPLSSDAFALGVSPTDTITEQVVEQHTVTFREHVLVVAYTNFLSFYVSVPSVCLALGLNVKGQIQRMKRTPVLEKGLRLLPLETRGGMQPTYCLHVEWLDSWLGGIRSKSLQMDPSHIDAYCRALIEAVYDIFHRVGRFSNEPALTNYMKRTPAPFEVIESPGEDPLLKEKLAILATIPPPVLTERFTATDSLVDRSMREATFAGENSWETDEDTRIFSTSHHLQIYLGTPQKPLDLPEAQDKIRQLGGSTILTARVVMGLWNLRRSDSRLSINGSAAIHIDEIFAWRGLQKHQRATRPGSPRQRTDGYRTEQKKQVLEDLKLLASCCVRGHCTVSVRGRRKTFYINGPYLRYSTVTTPTLWGEEEIVGFFLSPGDWITAYEAHESDFLVEIDRRVFLLNPQNEQHELRLALYLVERWRQQAKQGDYTQSLSMMDLLTASMIPIDRVNITRFATRIEDALHHLWKHGILGAEPAPLTPVEKSKTRWSNDWLASQWRLVPPLHVDDTGTRTVKTPSLNSKRSRTHFNESEEVR